MWTTHQRPDIIIGPDEGVPRVNWHEWLFRDPYMAPTPSLDVVCVSLVDGAGNTVRPYAFLNTSRGLAYYRTRCSDAGDGEAAWTRPGDTDGVSFVVGVVDIEYDEIQVQNSDVLGVGSRQRGGPPYRSGDWIGPRSIAFIGHQTWRVDRTESETLVRANLVRRQREELRGVQYEMTVFNHREPYNDDGCGWVVSKCDDCGESSSAFYSNDHIFCPLHRCPFCEYNGVGTGLRKTIRFPFLERLQLLFYETKRCTAFLSSFKTRRGKDLCDVYLRTVISCIARLGNDTAHSHLCRVFGNRADYLLSLVVPQERWKLVVMRDVAFYYAFTGGGRSRPSSLRSVMSSIPGLTTRWMRYMSLRSVVLMLLERKAVPRAVAELIFEFYCCH